MRAAADIMVIDIMHLSIDIPKPLEDVLRAEWGDLDLAAKESLIIESYRTGKLSIGQVATVLGFETRYQAEQWLGQHGVNWNYALEDLRADRETLGKLFGDKF